MGQRQACLVGLFLTVVGALSAGCADTISLGYQEQIFPPHVPGGERATVKVIVHDFRQSDRVGTKKGFLFGIFAAVDMGPIVTANDVRDFVEDALQAELRRRGFHSSGPPNVIVAVALRKYFNEFQTTVAAGDAQAEVLIDLRVYRGSIEQGPPVYRGRYQGRETLEKLDSLGGESAKRALDAAFANMMRTLLSDRQLMRALLQASQQPAAPTAPSAAPEAPSAAPDADPAQDAPAGRATGAGSR